MGCVASSAQPVRAARYIPPPIDYYEEEQAYEPPEVTIRDILKADVVNITQGLKRLSVAHSMRPAVVTEDNAFPLILSSFSFENDNSQEIVLPVIAISRVRDSKIIFFGNVDILTTDIIANSDSYAFFENLFSWATDFKATKLKVLLLGETQEVDFSGFGVICTKSDQIPYPNTYDIIFTTNEVPGDYKSLIESGTVIFYFATNASATSLCDFSNESQFFGCCGVSFAVTSLTLSSTRTKILTIDELQNYTLEAKANDLLKLLKNDEINIIDLDACIISLRYFVRACRGYSQLCYSVAKKCWKRLEATSYRNSRGRLFPEVEQSLLAMILAELFPKVPPKYVKAAPGIHVPNVNVKNHTFKIPLRQNLWNYTGHYLAPGVIGSVKADARCTIQIGAHALQLFMREGPWKRYPVISHRITIEKDDEVEIASPFGGICYVICEEPISIQISLQNFSMYPFFSYKKPELWEATKKYQVEWGEVSCKGLTLVMPTDKIESKRDKGKFCDMIGRLVVSLNSYVGPKLARSHRVVFEVDLPTNYPHFSEVLYMKMKDCAPILDEIQPNDTLMLLLSSLLLAELNGVFLSHEVELTFSKVAAAAALNTEWQDNDVSNNVILDNQRAFDTLLSIAIHHGARPFSTAIKDVVDNPNIKSGYDAWEVFSNRLVTTAQVHKEELEDLFWEVRKVDTNASNRLLDFIIAGDDNNM